MYLMKRSIIPCKYTAGMAWATAKKRLNCERMDRFVCWAKRCCCVCIRFDLNLARRKIFMSVYANLAEISTFFLSLALSSILSHSGRAAVVMWCIYSRFHSTWTFNGDYEWRLSPYNLRIFSLTARVRSAAFAWFPTLSYFISHQRLWWYM